MPSCQAPPLSTDAFKLRGERVGPLPLINRFLDRLGLEDLLDRLVPTQDRRVRLPYAKGLGLLLRSILVEREAIYRQQEIYAASGLRPMGSPLNWSATPATMPSAGPWNACSTLTAPPCSRRSSWRSSESSPCLTTQALGIQPPYRAPVIPLRHICCQRSYNWRWPAVDP